MDNIRKTKCEGHFVVDFHIFFSFCVRVLILCDVVFQQESEATSCSCAMRVRRHLSLFGSDGRTASSLSLRTHRSFHTVLVQFFYVSVRLIP